MQTKGHVKVLRHLVLRPDLAFPVRVDKGSILQSTPAKERVVTDERGDFTVGTPQADALVDTTGKMGDAVLKILPVDLHDTRFVLNDSDFRGFGHLECGVMKAVFGYDGVRVDDEDNLSDTHSFAVDYRKVGDQNPYQ